MTYSLIKNLHLTTIVLTLALFVLRGAWMLADSPRLQARWVRIVPHVNDTLLLASGITLSVLIQQYPLVQGWLTAKLVALIVYILLGTIALKRGKTKAQRVVAWVAALLVFGYIVAVAITHNPFPFGQQAAPQRNTPAPELSAQRPLYAVHLF